MRRANRLNAQWVANTHMRTNNRLFVSLLLASLPMIGAGCDRRDASSRKPAVHKAANACEYGNCQERAKWDVRWTTLQLMDAAASRGLSITTTEWTERRCDMHQQDGNRSDHVLRGARYRG